jgi:hypothetical protein
VPRKPDVLKELEKEGSATGPARVGGLVDITELRITRPPGACAPTPPRQPLADRSNRASSRPLTLSVVCSNAAGEMKKWHEIPNELYQ